MRIVLDVTTSIGWMGHDVGITRVERKLAQYYAEHLGTLLSDVIFVKQKTIGQFVELDPESVSRELAPPTARSTDDQAATPASSSLTDSILRTTKRVGLSTFSRLVDALPEQAQADFRAVAVHGERTAKHLVHHSRHRPSASRPTEQFGSRDTNGWPGIDSQDVYVSVGLDWDDKSLLKLRDLKRQYRFKSVHMVYDMIPTQFPHWLPSEPNIYDRYFTDLLCTADRLLCISETTQQAVWQFTQENSISCPETEVVILGADFDRSTQKRVPILDGTEFVLYVSTIEPRKNHRFLLELWTRLAANGPVPKLVFVGRPGWNCSEVLAAVRLVPFLAEHVLLLPTASDDELSWLYSHCLFTVYPSLYEGWGLPVVESLLSGKLCLASMAGAVIEAGHGLTTHLDTFDGPVWETEILDLLNDRSKLSDAESHIQRALPMIREKLSWGSFGSRAAAAIQKVALSE